MICFAGKFRGFLLHDRRTSAGKSTINAFLGGESDVSFYRLLLRSSSEYSTASHRNTLQHTATRCNTLQHAATQSFCRRYLRIKWSNECSPASHCNTLLHTATQCYTLLHTATHCTTLQHTTAFCNTLHLTATQCNKLPHAATHTYRYEATRDKTLQIQIQMHPYWCT